MTERKNIFVYEGNENLRGQLYALLGDYFNVAALAKEEYNPYKIWDYVQAAKPVCAILDAYIHDGSYVSRLYHEELPIILILSGQDKETDDYALASEPSAGFFVYGASSDELLKLIDKAVGLPEIKNYRRYFVFKDEKTNKFWSVEKEGASFLVNFGKMGVSGTKIEKTFDTEADCQKEIDKLIAKKIKEGYVEKADRSFLNKGNENG